MAHNFANKPL